MNSKFNKKTSRKCYRQKTGIYIVLLRNMVRSCSKLKETSFIRMFHESPKLRGFDLYGECSWKIEIKLMLFTWWKSCNGHLCYTVENSDVFTCKETFFGVAFNRYLEDTIFLCGLLFHRHARTSIYQRIAQELTKNGYKKDLFVFWTFKRTSLDLNWFYRSLGR